MCYIFAAHLGQLMWKKLTAAIFIIAFLVQTFSEAVIIIDFYANQKYIAENLCVNKDKPMMHCCGKCQLRKRLQQQQNSDKQNPEQRGNNKNEVLSSKSFFATAAPLVKMQEVCINYTNLSFAKEIKMPRSFFHPPGV